jgi:hypothetical protein
VAHCFPKARDALCRCFDTKSRMFFIQIPGHFTVEGQCAESSSDKTDKAFGIPCLVGEGET